MKHGSECILPRILLATRSELRQQSKADNRHPTRSEFPSAPIR